MKAILSVLCLSTIVLGQPDYYFPDDFVFGAATAAFQVEGGWDADGKGESIYDRAVHEHPDWVEDGSNGDVACDSYHKYREDVQLLKDMGANFYRFSVSWSRVLPTGKIDQINQPGIDYYNNLIDELLANGIQPYVTMFHWDLPQALQDEGGWPNRTLADRFVDYARLLFETYGDRVKHWMTFNEPMQICEAGYSSAGLAPFIYNPGIGGYECTHTLLLAHGRTYRMYDSDFRAEQNGQVGIAIDSPWHEPNNPDSADDQLASERSLQMNYGWFINPVIYGNYPDMMMERIANISLMQNFTQSRLPVFTQEEQDILRASFDFIGLNHYSTNLVYLYDGPADTPDHYTDVGVVSYLDPTWPGGITDWLKVVPWGIRKILVWIKENYGNPPIVITENGYSDGTGELEDYDRANYYKDYLYYILRAMHEDGCNVIGYAGWSLLDNMEWMRGYTQKFGLHYVNFTDPERPRARKLSTYVYNNIITTRHIDWGYTPDWPPAKK